ncbi:AhpC/TSA family protein [Rossellomorea aquimaris]|uniref:peroxiredoxin-like family protein n=1 Tax=Rossellomorea aquimaris TaxID=189382 RepID=UPI001CD7A778|nr:peroxiredoxin-like family protein [Rossellomorea aquimaris]MCA1055806.1 AhpC/TSA family protein [Rossellomorea aquimaris]
MSNMRQQFDEYISAFKQKASTDVQDKMSRAIEELESSDQGKGLSIGEKIPFFTLPDATGNEVSIQNLLQKGPVILTFYRGGWCPYCNMELRAYQELLDDIHDAGAELVAISPQTPDATLSTKEKNELQFTVLSDEGNKTADAFNLVYKLPPYLVDIYQERGLDLEKANDSDEWTLPVSATYVIKQDGTIAYEYTKADYKDRAEPSDVVAELKKL